MEICRTFYTLQVNVIILFQTHLSNIIIINNMTSTSYIPFVFHNHFVLAKDSYKSIISNKYKNSQLTSFTTLKYVSWVIYCNSYGHFHNYRAFLFFINDKERPEHLICVKIKYLYIFSEKKNSKKKLSLIKKIVTK